jgi:hypothetical protein
MRQTSRHPSFNPAEPGFFHALGSRRKSRAGMRLFQAHDDGSLRL